MEMAPCHEHPELTNDRSPGCSVEGDGRRFETYRGGFPHRDDRVVRDAYKNCQEKFRNFFADFPRLNPRVDGGIMSAATHNMTRR
jgi:hypothetical protein